MGLGGGRLTGVSLYRDEAIVLRLHKLGEADRIVTLLTRRHGRVRAVAKGIRRTSSKFGARLEPFTHVDVQLYPGRNLDIVSQVESIRPYGAAIASDYRCYTAGTAILETAERLTAEEREPSLRLFLLVIGALRAMTSDGRAPSLVLDAFLLRAMSVAGWEPALVECAICAQPGPHRSMSIPAGGVVCARCRPAGSANPSAASVALMAALFSGNWAGAEAANPATAKEASGLVAALLQWHLERGLRSLAMVERG